MTGVDFAINPQQPTRFPHGRFPPEDIPFIFKLNSINDHLLKLIIVDILNLLFGTKLSSLTYNLREATSGINSSRLSNAFAVRSIVVVPTRKVQKTKVTQSN